jgi:hypothetical protein
MSLDIYQIVDQIEKMASHLKLAYRGKSSKINLASDILKTASKDCHRLKEKIDTSRTTWLVAGLKEDPSLRIKPVNCPEDYAVVATDGSQIDVDRHQSTHCFLINVGGIQLQYGRNPGAEFFNQPQLFYRPEDVSIKTPDNRTIPIEGPILGIKRSVDELRVLAEKVKGLPKDLPVLAMMDGTLTLWGLIGQEYQDLIVDEFLVNGFLKYLDELKVEAGKRQLALVSYISFPRSTEVVNTLRLALCPHDVVNCDKFCKNNEDRECGKIDGLIDRDIFEKLLDVGERSSVFYSRSSIVKNYYGGHVVNFFYVKIDDEVVRAEVPQWVAENEKTMDLVHSIVLEQCNLGMGYPVALMESHEAAVVNKTDRDQFWQLVEQIMYEESMTASTSAKNQSKRMRWV